MHNEAAPTCVDTNQLKTMITSAVASAGMSKSLPSNAVNRPVGQPNGKSAKNEIFVDIDERLTVLFNANGYIKKTLTFRMNFLLNRNIFSRITSD